MVEMKGNIELFTHASWYSLWDLKRSVCVYVELQLGLTVIRVRLSLHVKIYVPNISPSTRILF
jgi:hypothetical protein